jgi:transcriptional regulator with XRE-family HTH domain
MRKAVLTAREVFARNVRRVRRLKDISQESLALDLGMSRPYLSSVERRTRNVSVDNMGRLAEALGVPLSDLVDPDKYKGLDETRDAGEGTPRLSIPLSEGTEGRRGLPQASGPMGCHRPAEVVG